MPKDSWSLLGTRYLSDHRIFRIRHDLYRFEPSGVEREFVVIESPDWVNVVPLTEDGQVVLIRQYRHGTGDVALEIPGGIIDPDESPQAAAVRELEEETGYVAERVRMLGRVRPNPAVQNNYQYMFLAEGCRRQSEPHLDPFERIEVAVRPADEIPQLVRREEICHALVINALAYAGLLKES